VAALEQKCATTFGYKKICLQAADGLLALYTLAAYNLAHLPKLLAA
jgi:hypothetical protein